MRRGLIATALASVSFLWALAYTFDTPPLAFGALLATGVGFYAAFTLPHANQPVSGSAPRNPPADGEPELSIPRQVADAENECSQVFNSPESLEPGSVVRALLANAQMTGSAQSAHLWLSDPQTGTLRLIASDGPAAPSSRPLDLTDPILGRAVVEGTVIAEELSRITTTEEGERLLVRVAFPIVTTAITGVAGVDYSDHAPSGASITQLGSAMRLPLASALALNAAHIRTQEAVELIDAARELSRSLDSDQVLQLGLDRAIRLSAAATGSIMLLQDDNRTLQIAVAHGLPEDVVTSTSVSLGEGIAGWVASSLQPVLVEDLPGKQGAGQRHGVRSAVSVPIADDEGLLGVLNVGSRSYPARFTKEHLETLEMLGRQTAVALRNAMAVSSVGEMFFDSLKTLALALETKDPYAAGGTERVLDYATQLASALHLESAEARSVEIAAMLHDVGMSALGPIGAHGIRPLSTTDRALLKMHPVVAADILKQAPALREVAPIVYHHHEHYNGAGYVAGSSGEDIPVGARILAVADAYVAMTSKRPYRSALTSAAAIDELSEKAGTQFDPDIVAAFIELLGSDSNRVRKTEEH